MDGEAEGLSSARLEPVDDGHRALPKGAEGLFILFRLTDRLYRATGMPEIFGAALEAIGAAFDCDRAAMLLFDEGGTMRFVAWRGLSDDYRAAVEGHSPWAPGQRDPAPIFVEDIETTDEPEAIKAAIRAEGIRALAFIPLVARGRCVGKFMTYHAGARAFTPAERELAAHVALRVGFGLERARAEEARRRAEAALRETENRFRQMSEDAPVMIWVSKPDGACLHLNRMLREFWAVDAGAMETFDWRTKVHPDDLGHVTAQIGAATAARRPVTVEARYLNAAGDYRVLATHARPRLGDGDEFLGLVGVNVDMTERREAEAQRELLLSELNHRVKNSLSVVLAIARQTFRNADSLEAARSVIEGRLMALASAHDLLIRGNWTTASLSDLARDTLAIREERPQVTISGPHVVLDPKQTLGLTLALHELYTNALKYGALSTEKGHVTLAWSATGGPGGAGRRLKIEWRESGGPAVAPPGREGFGSLLIRQVFTHDLGGEVAIEYAAGGLVCAAEAPL